MERKVSRVIPIDVLATVLILQASLFATVRTTHAAGKACIEWEFIDPARDYVVRASGYIRPDNVSGLPQEFILKASPEHEFGSVALTNLRIDQEGPHGASITGTIQVLGTEDSPYPVLGGMLYPYGDRDFWTMWFGNRDTGYYVYLRKNPPRNVADKCKNYATR